MYYHVTKRNLCAIFVLFALTLNVAWSGASSRSLIVSSSFLLSLLDSQSEWQQQYEKRCLKTGQSKRTIKTKSEKHAHQHSSSFGTLLLSSWLVLSSLIGDGVMLIRSLALRVSILNLSFGRYTSFFLDLFDGATHSFSSWRFCLCRFVFLLLPQCELKLLLPLLRCTVIFLIHSFARSLCKK